MATNKFYRSNRGVFLGVLQGLADYRDLPVKMLRFAFVVLCCIGLFIPMMIAYFVAAFFLLEVEPSGYDSSSKYEHNSYRERRSKEEDWDSRFYS